MIYSFSVVLSTFAMLVVDTDDTMSEICSSVVMVKTCYLFQRCWLGELLRRGLLVPVLVFPATPLPRANDVYAVISIYICFFNKATFSWQFCFLESGLDKILSKSIIQFLTDTDEVTFRILWNALSLAMITLLKTCSVFFGSIPARK